MRKKKKGSTLITVLALSIVFMALGVAILTAIMGTMKSNTNQKIREDLKYAAESGLEIARSHFKKGNMTIDTRAGEAEDNLDNVLETGIVERVDIFTENINGEDRIRSIAYSKNGNKKESISTKYLKKAKGSNTNIFEHGLVSGEGGVAIINGGSTTGTTSTISTPSGTISGKENAVGEIKPNDIKKVEFKNWNIPEKKIIYKIDKEKKKFYNDETEIPVLDIEISLNGKSIDFNLIKIMSNLENNQKEQVVRMKVKEPKTNPEFEVILVNSEKFIIETSIQIANTVIINNGKTSITGPGDFALNSSTIFANEIIIDNKGAVNITYQPLRKDHNSHGALYPEYIDKLNNLLSKVILNWNDGNNGSGEEKIELIEGSFSDQ